MDSTKRILVKAITWQMSGLVVMTLVGYVFTGSLTAGSGIAVTGMLIGFLTYMLHEHLWARIGWGRRA